MQTRKRSRERLISNTLTQWIYMQWQISRGTRDNTLPKDLKMSEMLLQVTAAEYFIDFNPGQSDYY